jgi:hypothetical protein
MRRLLIVLAAAAMALADDAPARAWLDTIRLQTYSEGPADPTPHYPALSDDNPAYPYPARTTFTNNHHERSWRTLNLENEYLFCRVLPDWGGHLYNCRDKRNGREVFYANPVIKPGPVGLRSAWIATGIESNFPIGHSFVSASPVDFGIHSDSDGAARAVVEEMDHITGMQWRVEFILRPGSALLEQRVLLYNRADGRWPFYWWANAGLAYDDPNSKFILPTRVAISHTSPPQFQVWPPRVKGKDGTVISNLDDKNGWFAYGSREPFFAVYKPGSRSGIVHVADPGAVAGKKVWVFGPEGDRYFKTDLTDNAPAYFEMQGGVFQEQETFEYLLPEQSKSFSEYWLPAVDMDGITRATQDCILYAERRNDPSKGDALVLQVGVTHALKGAVIRVLSAGAPVFDTTVDLTPAATFTHVIDKPVAAPYVIQVMDARGSKVLLEHTEGVYDSTGPEAVKLGVIQSRDWSKEESTESFYLEKGAYSELYRLRNSALSDYSKGMQKFPGSMPLKKAAGRLDVTLNRFAEATGLLTTVLAADPADDETRYYLGAAQAALRQDEEARLTLSKLPPDSSFIRSVALLKVRLAARSKDYAGGVASFKPLLSGYFRPGRLGAIEVALLRNAGRKEEASKELTAWLNADPSNSLLRYESTLAGATDDDLWQHLAADSERVLSIADEYFSLGMFADALPVLDHPYPALQTEELEPGAVPAARNPLIAYYRAYCRTRLGQDDKADLGIAAANYGPYVFPWRATTFDVLGSAVAHSPDDAVAHFLLGRLLLHNFMMDEAISEWQKARALNPKLAGLSLELSTALVKLKNDPAHGLIVAKEGLEFDPQNAELRKLLGGSTANLAPAAAAAPPKEIATLPVPDAASAAMLKAASNPTEALQIFHSPQFAAEKQPDSVRRAYIEAQLQNLLSMSRSGRCEKALDSMDKLGDDENLPFTFRGFKEFMKQAHFQYYLAVVEAACKEHKNAQKRWAKVAAMKEALPSPEFAFPLLAAARTNGAEAQPKIASALESVRAGLAGAAGDSKTAWLFLEGMLLRAKGDDEQSVVRLQEVAKSSKEVALTYLALAETTQIFAARK